MNTDFRFIFNEKVATQAACKFIECYDGEMYTDDLILLMYLAERQCMKRWHKLCGDSYSASSYGIRGDGIMKCLGFRERPTEHVEFAEFNFGEYWDEHIWVDPRGSFKVSMIKVPVSTCEYGCLCPRHVNAIRALSRMFKGRIYPNLDSTWIYDCIYDLPEYKPEHHSLTETPLSVMDILRGLGKSDDDIEEYIEDMEGHYSLLRLFSKI